MRFIDRFKVLEWGRVRYLELKQSIQTADTAVFDKDRFFEEDWPILLKRHSSQRLTRLRSRLAIHKPIAKWSRTARHNIQSIWFFDRREDFHRFRKLKVGGDTAGQRILNLVPSFTVSKNHVSHQTELLDGSWRDRWLPRRPFVACKNIDGPPELSVFLHRVSWQR